MTLLVQPHLPGTLPSPREARQALIDSKRQLAEARALFDRMKEARKVSAEMLADAEDERAERLADLEDDNTPATTARYVAAVETVRERETGLAGAKLAVKEARASVKRAEARRRGTDEVMLAIAHGRRGGDA